MRCILLGIFLGALSLSDAAFAQQRSGLAGNPTTPPPMRLPPSLSNPHSLPHAYPNSPSLPDAQAMPPMRQIPMQPCQPHECETMKTIEEARAEFAQCMNEAKRSDGTFDEGGFEDCVFGWMAPDKAETFSECWSDPKNTPWTCFSNAYLAPGSKSSNQQTSRRQPSGLSNPLPDGSSQKRERIGESGTAPNLYDPTTMAQCLSLSRNGPNSWNENELDSCLRGFLMASQMDRFWHCVGQMRRGYDFCFNQAVQ